MNTKQEILATLKAALAHAMAEDQPACYAALQSLSPTIGKQHARLRSGPDLEAGKAYMHRLMHDGCSTNAARCIANALNTAHPKGYLPFSCVRLAIGTAISLIEEGQ